MASNIPTRRHPQAQSTTITPKSSKVQKQPPKGGSTLAERAADNLAEALLRRKSAVQNKRLRRQTIGYSIPKTPVTPSRVFKRQSITPTATPIRVSQQNKGQRTAGNTIMITSTTTSHRGVCSKSSGHRNLRPRKRSSMSKVGVDSSSEADSTNSDPFDLDYWTWDEAEKNHYHIDKATSKKLWYKAPT